MACPCKEGPVDCDRKYYNLITQNIPNQNKSHVTGQPIPDDPCQVATECSNDLAELQAKGFPRSGPPELHQTSCYDVPTGHQRACECPTCIKKREGVIEEECSQHVEGNKWIDLQKRHFDPEIQALRDRMRSSEGVKENLRWCPDDEWNTCVLRKFRQYPTGNLGEATVHYGAAQDCDFPKSLVHGVVSDDLTPGDKLINPPPKTWIEQLDVDLKESIYASNRFAPVGRSHDQLPNLPLRIDPETTIFGIPTDKSVTAAMLVNPPKDRHQVEAEHECCRALYKKTHDAFNPGEQLCRNYVGDDKSRPMYRRTDTFGDLTPHDVAGRSCAKVIGGWRTCKPDPPYVNKVYADHVDQRIPKLGIPQDRLCGNRDRGDNFTYGKKSDQERERPTREIIFNRCPNEGAEKAMTIMHNLKNWIDKMRKNFKSDRGANLESLYEEFTANDPECNGTIDWEPFMRCLIDLKIPRTMELEDFLEALTYVNVFHPSPCNKVNYYLLMDVIQGHEDPKFKCKTTTLTPYYCPHTNSCIHFRTTYADQTANMCVQQSCIQWAKENRVFGMPSIRTDTQPRRIRSTKDTTNYGDDGDAYSLIWPSVYTTRGLTCRDIFREYSQEEMLKILCRAGIQISRNDFELAWEKAKELDPEGKGRVCYQTFREAVEKNRLEFNARCGLSDKYKIMDCCHDPEDGSCIMCIAKRKAKPNPCAGVDP